jgi:uncharacterized membrane protein
MNTVFKFYIQAWVLLGLACGAALPALWRKLRRCGWGGVLWRGVLALMLLAAFAYPVQAVPARVAERFPGAQPPIGTLDGTAYMLQATYYWPDDQHPVAMQYDRAAIAWLWQHIQGTPVIAEAPLGYYREGGLRVSSYTGLPTLVGAHEREQRPSDEVGRREDDAAALYTTTDPAQFQAILRRYRVRYIYVGQLERDSYAGPGLDKFEALVQGGELTRLYENARVTVYQVSQDWDTQM